MSLKLDVFIAGAVIMALEILGSRLLAPVFGNSIFMWGSLIGVVLAALSVGYYLGGKIADRRPDFTTFSLLIFASGVLVVAIPYFAPSVFDLIVSLGLGERYGPLLATSLFLAPPGVLLGAVSPYAIRLVSRNVEQLGRTSGKLYSLSSIGSIFGTFFTVFVLIPQYGVNRIILALGVVLLAISVLGLNAKVKVFVLLFLIITPFLAPYTTRRATVAAYTLTLNTVVFETDTPYHHIVIADSIDPLKSAKIRTLLLDDNFHSAMDLNDPQRAVYLYTEYFHMGFLFNPDIHRVLFIGGGGFTGPKRFLNAYPNIMVDVVEIDPEVIRVAKEYFGVTNDPRLRIFAEDGRNYLHRSTVKYDLVVLDAYSKTFVPFHLMTRQFFEEVHRDLTERGVVIMNLITFTTGPGSNLLKAEFRTIGTVFANVYAFATKGTDFTFPQNVMLTGVKESERYTAESLLARARGTSVALKVAGLEDYVKTVMPVDDRSAPIFTDDFAPVETLLNPVTNQPLTRRDEDEAVISLEVARLVSVALLILVGGLIVYRFRHRFTSVNPF